MMPTSGAASFMALIARGMTPPGSAARLPSASFRAPSMWGKMAMAGMPSRRASTAARAQSFTDRRLTPGMEATGTSPSPSCTTIDQIRSAGVSTVSRTRRRIQSAWRRRRRRRAG